MQKRRHPEALCESCPLFETGEFGLAAALHYAELAIVGEAPGVNESRIGKPFVGQSGRLLGCINEHNKIDREETF